MQDLFAPSAHLCFVETVRLDSKATVPEKAKALSFKRELKTPTWMPRVFEAQTYQHLVD